MQNPITWRPVLWRSHYVTIKLDFSLFFTIFFFKTYHRLFCTFSSNYLFPAFYQQRKQMSEKLHSHCLGAARLNVEIWQATVMYSPQDSASTTASKEVAVAICLKSLVLAIYAWVTVSVSLKTKSLKFFTACRQNVKLMPLFLTVTKVPSRPRMLFSRHPFLPIWVFSIRGVDQL